MTGPSDAGRTAATYIARLDTAPRLRFVGQSMRTDPTMARVLGAAADAWESGSRAPLVMAVVDLADSLIADVAGGT